MWLFVVYLYAWTVWWGESAAFEKGSGSRRRAPSNPLLLKVATGGEPISGILLSQARVMSLFAPLDSRQGTSVAKSHHEDLNQNSL